ncbi:MAG: dienelactone hydrolase family protein, partial [Gammaproteobacteria bacterium]|nr:dienelactone hydrolase family protein [Gammaproteobacteria bacterium]
MQRLMWCVLLFAFAVTVQAKVVTKEVNYSADGLSLKGYLAYDDAQKQQRPGVLVVHEWWGQNDYVRKRARMLAELGYVALALDMYGEGKQAAHPEDASKFSGEVMKNLNVAEQRFMAGLTLLQQQPQTNKRKVAAIGYCFGGGVVLAMARRGVDLDGVASFHGSLAAGAPAAPGKVKARVLVLNGADD